MGRHLLLETRQMTTFLKQGEQTQTDYVLEETLKTPWGDGKLQENPLKQVEQTLRDDDPPQASGTRPWEMMTPSNKQNRPWKMATFSICQGLFRFPEGVPEGFRNSLKQAEQILRDGNLKELLPGRKHSRKQMQWCLHFLSTTDHPQNYSYWNTAGNRCSGVCTF